MAEEKTWFSLIVFLSFLAFLSALVPPEYRVMSAVDFAVLGGSFIGVAGACAIATGIPCAAALVIFGVVSILQNFVIQADWVRTLIFVPITMLILYLALRIARGGG